MKYETIKASKEFHIMGSGIWLSIDGTLGEGDNIREEIKKMDAILTDAFNGLSGGVSDAYLHPTYGGIPSTIEVERPIGMTEKEILSCTDLEVLKSYEFIIDKKYPQFRETYDLKYMELSKK